MSYPEEPITAKKGVTLVVYQSILALFDSMDLNERMEFIELATVFRDLSPEDRKYLVNEANSLAHRGQVSSAISEPAKR